MQKVTLASWIKSVIIMSGQSGTGGSSRSVVSTRAIGRGADLQAVMATGDWARESTFRRFYYKPSPLSFVQSVLL